MKTLLNSSMKQRRAWFLAAGLLALFCRLAPAQSVMVSNYSTFMEALDSHAPVITNFLTNTIISLATPGQTIQISHSVVIDGGTNAVAFDGNAVTRIFTVATNCLLTLNNLQVINGSSTNGGAIYSYGALIISNCILSGNSATNFSGASGSTNAGGNGGSGGNGGTAEGGAIYSRGPVSIYYSVLGTNSSLAGNGGTGAGGGSNLLFGGSGGNGGSGGGAYGAAVFSSGSNNVFVSTEFFYNNCVAGAAGGGGSPGSGAFGAYGGHGAPGGASAGGAVYVTGPVFVTNCIFALNTVAGGASGTDQFGENGFAGGSAEGGGVFITGAVTNSHLENSVFFNNTCSGGAGGGSTVGSVNGGNGGSALGGGLASAAVLATIRNCTLATNTLVAGTNGAGTVSGGSYGSTGGWDLYRAAGAVKLSGSILSGGTNVAPNAMPNALGVTDAGYNISSDASLARAYTNTLINSNAVLDSGLANYGGPAVGPPNIDNPPLFLTLAVVAGSPAIDFIPGVPGLSFPATDELGNPRGSPSTAGAYEFDPIAIDTNALSFSITFDSPAAPASNVLTYAGGTVTMSVTADASTTNPDTNNPIPGYQWQLNGTNLPDNKMFVGATSPSLTIKGVTPASEGPYQVIVSVSLLENAATSPVVSVVITNPVKIVTQPVSKTSVPFGSAVNFSVGVTGSGPLSFQWYLQTTSGATMLADTNEISGSATSNLTINPVTAIDQGSYYVVVTNDYNSVTSKAAVLGGIVLDTTKPTVEILSPAAGARTANNVVTGTASDNAQVIYVNYWVTNVNAGLIPARTVTSNTASLGASGTTAKTWSITNALSPGTNYVTAQSVDYSGNKSALSAPLLVFFKSPAVFALIANGPGSFTGSASVAGDVRPANGALLNIGEGYALTALPAKNYVLSNWVSSTGLTTNSPAFHFIMESGLTNTANFGANLFIGAAGTYNGLFYDPNDVTEQSAGMLKNLALLSTGSYSAKLLLGSASYTLLSAFNTSGYASNYVKRTAAQGGPLAVEMTLDWTSGEITGSVSSIGPGAWISSLRAEKSAATPLSAEYTALLEAGAGTNAIGDMPPGFGYMLITNHNGSVTLSGALADGSTFSQTVPLGVSGDAPVFYPNLYGNTGLLLGWLGLSNGTVEVETPMAWFKPQPAAKSGIYTAGFTNFLTVTGSGWTNPPSKTSAISLLDGFLTITNTSLALEFPISITNDTVVKAPGSLATNSLTGTIAPKTGLLQVTFGNGAGKATTIGYGVMLQDSTNGGGYFVTKTNAGAIQLGPPAAIPGNTPP